MLDLQLEPGCTAVDIGAARTHPPSPAPTPQHLITWARPHRIDRSSSVAADTAGAGNGRPRRDAARPDKSAII